jgi:two-component system, OmpR family, alkaline phosphatase synthesis response regulator PhoP
MPPSPVSEPARPVDASRAARVLIADDNPQGAELLEAYLAETDYDVQIAADGDETLHKVRDWRPDLILLDIMMPKISGFEVCKRLRADPATADIVVLMITALDQPSDIDRAVEAGTNDFLTKPINKTELLLRVRSALRSRQYKEQLDQALAYIEGVERDTP